MAVLISDQISGWRADSAIEEALIKILRSEINFKFRRVLGKRFLWGTVRICLLGADEKRKARRS